MSLKWKSYYNVFIYNQEFSTFLYTYALGQESDKCNQIAASKNSGDLMTLSVILSLHGFKIFLTILSIEDLIVYIAITFKISTFCIVVKIDRLLPTNYRVTFIFTQCQCYISVNNNYLQLGKTSIIHKFIYCS